MMARAGMMTRDQAAFEFDNFLTINHQVRIKDSYMIVRRTDATLSLSRAQRLSVYMMFENAQNHAEFQ
jgi:hypothetical protein